jgi:FdhD protein
MNRPLQHLLSPDAAMACPVTATSLAQDESSDALLCLAEEEPVAFRYNGLAHGVMMATPADLEDFAVGFSLTEGIISEVSDIDEISVAFREEGILIDISLTGKNLHQYLAHRRVRQLRGNTSCGLCGVEDLDDIRRPASRVRATRMLDPNVIAAVQSRLREWQPLSRLTRGAHAAAWLSFDGQVEVVKEDVGRHNALDKLIGAGLRGGFSAASGFCLITSRCSFEMVQKAIAAGFSALVSVSLPTARAVRSAQGAGLSLYALSRDGALLQFASPSFSEI